MRFEEVQLTHDASGHCINSTQCFSFDDQWIVFDGRNHDTMIAGTSRIAMVNTNTGEIRLLYETAGQSSYGPGVGAATFSPVAYRVLFIHGIRNADAAHPYSITRRTGTAVDLDKPGIPVFMDARDVLPPYTSGALRGGTHAHTWSADGEWISFTYNDHILEQAGKSNKLVKDLRTVGIMVPGKKVVVPENGVENNNGEMFSMLVAAVKNDPQNGSGEIEKAFDETWIGSRGYQKKDGSWQRRAIAYQGNLRDVDGRLKTEIFVVDIPEDILERAQTVSLTGTDTTRPALPPGLESKRISHTAEGVSSQPRHWLRSSPDGSMIAFLAQDPNKHIQLFTISPNGGATRQLTAFDFSIQGPFNFSPDGKYIAYPADNSIFITDLQTLKADRISDRFDEEAKPVGAVNWSHDGNTLAYNRYVETDGKKYLQIFLLNRR